MGSLLIPSLDKLEVIIENDGSKDATAVIGKKYEEQYPGVFVLVNKENGGYGSTINNSIRLATGKYFKQLDGDDWYHTEHLEELVTQLESIEADCVYTPHLKVYEDSDSQSLELLTELNNGLMSVDDFVKIAGVPQMHTMAFRTQLLRENNITILEHCFYTDQEYVLYPLMQIKTVYVFDKYIYCYRLGVAGQSVSLEGWRKHIGDHERVIKQLMARYDAWNNGSPIVNSAILYHICSLLRDHNSLYMVLGDKQVEMKQLDAYIRRKHPVVYMAKNKVEGKRIKLIRWSGFTLYMLLRKKTFAG